MHHVRKLLIATLLFTPAAVFAAPPDAESFREAVMDAAGGVEAFRQLGVLQIAIEEEETLSSGKSTKRQQTSYVDAMTLTNLRLELPGDIVIGRYAETGWATRDGVMDDRIQTTLMAKGTLNQRLFPLLLPFSLSMPGVTISQPRETNFEGEPAWRAAITFEDGFFTAPSMSTTWFLHVRRSDHTVLAIEFFPPEGVRQVRSEGIRYRLLQQTTLGSAVKVPVQVLFDGIDVNGAPTGHVRVTKMRITIRGPFEPALFLDPIRLEEIEKRME